MSTEVVTGENVTCKQYVLNHTPLISQVTSISRDWQAEECRHGSPRGPPGRTPACTWPRGWRRRGGGGGGLLPWAEPLPTWGATCPSSAQGEHVCHGGPCSKGSVYALTPQEERKVSQALSSDYQVIAHEGLVPFFQPPSGLLRSQLKMTSDICGETGSGPRRRPLHVPPGFLPFDLKLSSS